MAKVPKQPRNPATPAGFYRDRLINQYLTCYAEDPDFIRALQRLFTAHRPAFEHVDRLTDDGRQMYPLSQWREVQNEARYRGPPALVAYVKAMTGFGADWGLDRLPDDLGIYAIHSACLWYYNDRPSVWRFAAGEAHELHAVEGMDYTTSPASVVLIPEVRWRPEQESRSQALARIEAAAQGARQRVDAVLRAYHDAEYVYPPDSAEEQKYLDWLYRRVARREPDYAVAADAGYPPETIRKKTGDYKRLLGISRIPHPRR